MPSHGVAESTEQGRENVRNLFDEFRNSSPETRARYNKPFKDLPENIACCQETFSQFLHYLIHVYEKKGKAGENKPLKVDVALQYLRNLLHQASVIWKSTGTDRTKLFFTCLDRNAETADAKWLQGLKKNAARVALERLEESGGAVEPGTYPIGLCNVMKMIEAYARHGSQDAVMRGFALLTLWLAAGRSGEVSCLSWTAMQWDDENQCVFTQWIQKKTSKTKFVVFMAGANRQLCWFLRVADHFAVSRGGPTYEEGKVDWTFPSLVGKHSGITYTYIHIHMHVYLCMYA